MFIGKLPHGGDLLYSLNRLVRDQSIKAGYIQLMGGLQRARLSHFDQLKRAYRELSFDAPHEIVSGTGNISLRDDTPYAHLHLAISDSEGRVVGGHCLEGCTIYAVEYVIIPFVGVAPRRIYDETTGLYQWEKDSYSF